jgi:hypothetical protein
MWKSQLLFQLLHVYFSGERCSLSRAWDHPGQWNRLETDGLLRWSPLGTSWLTSLETAWEIWSHCTTGPGYSFKPEHTQMSGEWGRRRGVDFQQFLSYLPFQVLSLPEPHLLIYFLIPPTTKVPVIVQWPTWKSACRFENPGPFQVSVVATFITHERDREPQLSTETLVFTLLYLFIDFATAHTGAQGASIFLTKPVSFARKSRQV